MQTIPVEKFEEVLLNMLDFDRKNKKHNEVLKILKLCKNQWMI